MIAVIEIKVNRFQDNNAISIFSRGHGEHGGLN